MRSHLIIGQNDYTDYIVADSYDVNANDVYESWKDGNMMEHRIIVASKVKGKFKVALSDDTLSLANFLTAWNSAVVNGVITLGLYVTNQNAFKALNCYYSIKSAQHIKSTGGKLYDVLEIELTER